MSGRPAAFLDRDGTIIRDSNYLRDPADIVLLPDAPAAIRRLNERDIAVIVVTNQSGIARGLLNDNDYQAVRARLDDMLLASGARIDASYMCPHHPDVSGACECRKPGTGLYRRAIVEHDLDGARSLYVGDRWRDVAPARSFGGTGIMLLVESTPPDDRERARAERLLTASSLSDAVDRFLRALPRPADGQ
jgi:D-glycero-D-manno-heptose 1,7-bisphosphate phosphatase